MTLALVVCFAPVAAVKPELFFDVDAAAAASSLGDELRGTNSIYGCRERKNDRFLCEIGEIGSGICCEVTVKLGDDRCWRSLRNLRGVDPKLRGCIGLTDYVFDGVPSFNR